MVLSLSDPAAAATKSLQSCPTLCDPIDSSPPGSSVPGILQAKILEWVAISFSNACMHAKSLQLCLILCDPMDSTHQAPPSMGFSRYTGVGCHFLSIVKPYLLAKMTWSSVCSAPPTGQCIRSDQISRSVVSDSLRPHESQHARPPCPSPVPGVHSDSRPSSQWCHPAIHPLSSPSPLAPNPSQHQSLFQWVNSSHEVAKVLEFQL